MTGYAKDLGGMAPLATPMLSDGNKEIRKRKLVVKEVALRQIAILVSHFRR